MRSLWNSLQFKIPTVFIVSFLLVLAAIFGVFSTIGKNLLEQQAYKQVILSGQNIVSELGNRIALAEALATALANLAEKLPPDDELNRKLVEHLLDYKGTEAFIAGGGIWPEPYKYDPKVERRSFFWGRDSEGTLRYYDDYNNPRGPGYHNEEWYVPAAHVKEGHVFWSKSYMDPYSYQPMVTVTVPMFRDTDFYGVSTVDLKLEGLHTFLEKVSRSFGGYAFAVDRNGKFLSFPNEELTKIYGEDAQGGRTQEFINVSELVAKQPGFEPLAEQVQESIDSVISTARQLDAHDEQLAMKLATDSYQITENEAELIAAMLAVMQASDGSELQAYNELFLENDLLLGEPAFAAVFEMPRTYWKIVTVMPYSKAVEASNTIYRNLVSAIVIVMLLSLVVMLFVVRRVLVKPITDMSEQLQILSSTENPDKQQLEIADKGELGNLAYWFNQRSEKLLETQDALREAREKLEQRVTERTQALRKEMEKRKGEQVVKEARSARVEKQHSAIIELSLHKSLFEGDIGEAARIITEKASEAIDVARTSVWLFDDTHDYLELVDLYERNTDKHSSDSRLKVEEYPSYFSALENDRSISVSDMVADKRTSELAEYAAVLGISSLLDSPIRVGGTLRGVVCFEHAGEKRRWHEDEIRFAGEIADQFNQALSNAERIRTEEQIRQLAFYDPLTSLANRRMLQETIQHELEVARRQRLYGSLLYLDLDNFKTLNDSLGHHVGDELLVQLSRRLRDTLRKEDIAARLGGDEFVVLITAENGDRHQAMEQALNVAQKVQAAISEPYRLHGYEHVITSSMGITFYPENNDTAADILKQADTAMYRAKDDGRNTIAFYNPQMQKAADNRLLLEKELRRAVADREFEMYYQPQVDTQGCPVGAEALIRWNHPDKGIVSPADFIPVTEETGLILELGNWILRAACEFSKACRVKHVAVNISPLQFRQADFVDNVTRILKATGAEPESLMIELTEGIVIENVQDTIKKMKALKRMGIRFAIDDFGTGYSSLAYLKQLPLDQLKINDKFVRDVKTDPSDAVIVETIISMARHLGLNVVAEGVETLDQLSFLNEKGCQMFQGYYFSTPLTKDACLEFLASYTPGREASGS
jgi:diguanylate cyclase (GGDEF)-like protein